MTTRATQAELLEQRIAENRASQDVDMVGWIFEHLHGDSKQVLELCSGTGGQTLRLLQMVGDCGQVVALDVSKAALDTLAERAGSNSSRLTTVQADMDNVEDALSDLGLPRRSFDLIFCAYGLYYSTDAKQTLNTALSWLKPGGRIVVVGPFGPNNGPLFELVRQAGAQLSEAVIASSERFMTDLVVPWAAVHFQSTQVHTLVNKVRWSTAERVLNYWKNTTFYSAEHQPEFERLLAPYFVKGEQFTNEKWIMMVEMTDARS